MVASRTFLANYSYFLWLYIYLYICLISRALFRKIRGLIFLSDDRAHRIKHKVNFCGLLVFILWYFLGYIYIYIYIYIKVCMCVCVCVCVVFSQISVAMMQSIRLKFILFSNHIKLFACSQPLFVIKVLNVTDCNIVARKFELQLRYYVPFRTNTLRKGMNPFITPSEMY